MKNSDIPLISVQNIDCWYALEPPRQSNSNAYPQSMFESRNKKNSLYPYKKGKRKVQGTPQSQTAAPPRQQEEERNDKTKQAEIEQMYEKHLE